MRGSRWLISTVAAALSVACIQLLELQEDVPYAPDASEAASPDTPNVDSGADADSGGPVPPPLPENCDAPGARVWACFQSASDWADLLDAAVAVRSEDHYDAESDNDPDADSDDNWRRVYSAGCAFGPVETSGGDRITIRYADAAADVGAAPGGEFEAIDCAFARELWTFDARRGFRFRSRFRPSTAKDIVYSVFEIYSSSGEALYSVEARENAIDLSVDFVRVFRIDTTPDQVIDLQIHQPPNGGIPQVFVDGKYVTWQGLQAPSGIGSEGAVVFGITFAQSEAANVRVPPLRVGLDSFLLVPW